MCLTPTLYNASYLFVGKVGASPSGAIYGTPLFYSNSLVASMDLIESKNTLAYYSMELIMTIKALL